MDLNFKGKTAVVTGGSKGIGFAVAKEFLKEGANVFICARNQGELEGAVNQLSKLNGAGSIVNISSLAAHAATAIRSNIYASMKAAVIAYTQTIASEYALYKIRVNAVLPGYTKTPLVQGAFSEAVLDELLKNNIMKRMAEPVEIAKPVVFLSSPAASYITGIELEVTGGHIKVLNARESWEQA